MHVNWMTGGVYFTNNFLAEDGISPDALLIDASFESEDPIAEAERLGLVIKAVVATHTHLDHVGGIAAVKEKLDIPFMIGEFALESLRAETARAAANGFTIDEPPEPDRLLSEGDVVEVGTRRFQILNTPGHWRGDISLYEPKANAVFVGDSMNANELGRFNEGHDIEVLVESVRSKLLTLPDDTRLFPGHGDESTIGEARRINKGVQELILGRG